MNPGELLEISGYFWKTCALHAAVKLDVFTVIGDVHLTVEEISQKLSGSQRGMIRLLNALTAMDLLVKTDGKYANNPSGKTFLAKDSAKYIGHIIMHHHHLLESWSQLDQAVLSGRPVRNKASFSDDEWRKSFLLGMFNLAMGMAPKIVPLIDLSSKRHLLDLGGGPGTFAIHFCLANPGLKAVVYDLETTRPFAERTIKKFNISDRIDFLPGNYITDDNIEADLFDAAWLSHILHGEGPKQAREIIGKAVTALSPGSKIFIHEFILNDTMDGPLFPALFSMNMYLGTPGGQSYSETQLRDMLKAHGVKDIKRLSFVGPTQSGILSGITS